MEVALGAYLERGSGDQHWSQQSSQFPTSGADYLRMVQKEAAACSEVKIATIEESKWNAGKQTVGAWKSKPLTSLSPEFLPSLHWQMGEAAKFAYLRQDINRRKTQKEMLAHVKKPTLPQKNDQDSWCRFCLGEEACQALKFNINGKDKGFVQNLNSEDDNVYQRPLMCILLPMPQKRIHMLLDYHVAWMRKIGFSEIQGMWIYALLAFLEKPLLGETVALLRILARLSAQIRDQMASTDSDRRILAGLNLIITIVGRYFDQKDLLEDIA